MRQGRARPRATVVTLGSTHAKVCCAVPDRDVSDPSQREKAQRERDARLEAERARQHEIQCRVSSAQ